MCIRFWLDFQATIIFLFWFCQIDITESWGWRIYRASMGKWSSIRQWFLSPIKGIRVEIEIIASMFQWHLKQHLNFLCKINIVKSWGWRIYRAKPGKWHQMWIWLKGSVKGFWKQIEVITSVFDRISKQRLNFPLFL